MDALPRPVDRCSLPRATPYVGMPQGPILSGQAWVGDRAAALLPLLTDSIRESCAAYSPLGVFLGGSALHGELCGIVDPHGERIYLSDLDLGVLTERPVPAGARDRINRTLRELGGDGPSCRLGFYHAKEIGRQHPTLGLVETARIGIALSGDASIFRQMRMPGPERIPPAEARRLLANRVLEWLAAAAEREASPLGLVYASAKLHADAGAVVLIAGGAYRGGGYRERLSQLGAARLAPSEREKIESWTAWRLDPRWDQAPVGGVGQASRVGPVDAAAAETARALIESISGPDSVERLFAPCRVRGRAWARSWKRWALAGGSARAFLQGGTMAATPRVLLWTAAVEQLLGREDRASAIMNRLRAREARRPESVPGRIVRLAALMEREGIE